MSQMGTSSRLLEFGSGSTSVRWADVVAIPGASSVEQLEFNVAAADIELSTQSRDALTNAARAFRPVSTLDYFSERIREKLGRR